MLRALTARQGCPLQQGQRQWAMSRLEAKAEAFDGAGAEAAGGVTRGFVGGFDQHGVHLDVAFGDFKACWQAIEKFFDDALAIHADHAAMRPGHAYIGDVRGALGQHMLIGGGHVRMRSDHRRGSSIQIPTHGDFLAGGFRMHVDEDEVYVRRKPGELAVGLAEWVIDSRQKGAALKIQHRVLNAVFGGAAEKPAAWAAIRKIRGAQQARLVGQVIHDFAAVPAVIAAGEDVDSVVEKFVGQARGDAESGSGIFAIGDDQIDFFLGHDVGETVANDLASWRANDVTDEENTHAGSVQMKGCGSKESMLKVLEKRLAAVLLLS